MDYTRKFNYHSLSDSNIFSKDTQYTYVKITTRSLYGMLPVRIFVTLFLLDSIYTWIDEFISYPFTRTYL